MAETQLLRQSAIVRNVSIGTSPPHGPVKTGELPLVQVRATPGGPQVKSQPAKAVEILPPRDEASAIRTGGLPMVNIKMTSQGPQLDDGQDRPVIIKDNRRGGAVATAGGLPMVQVKMDNGRPQIQNVPNVQDGPPRIQNAPTAVSQQRSTYRVATPVTSAPRGGFRIAAPQASPQVVLPPMPEFNADQLMLLRHVADKYLGDLRTSTETSVESEDGDANEAVNAVNADNIQIATSAIETIDQMMVTVSVRAEAAEKAEAAKAAAGASFAPVNTPSIVPAAPTASYVAGRVGSRSFMGRGVQRNAGMAPRRVSRGGSPLPPVIVKMDGGRSVVQNQEEVAAARAEALTPRTVQVPAPETVSAEVVSAEVVEGDVQG